MLGDAENPRPSRAAPALFAVLVIVSALAAAACGPGDAPPPKVKHEDPGVHLRRIGKVWREEVEDEGLPDRDPEIAFFRIRTVLRVELADDGKSTESIDRV